MRLPVDATAARARPWFGEHGIAATPVRQLGLRDSDDGSIWNFPTAGDWTVVTKDEDFVACCIGNPAAPTVVWLRIGTAFSLPGSNRCCRTSKAN